MSDVVGIVARFSSVVYRADAHSMIAFASGLIDTMASRKFRIDGCHR